MEVCTKSIKIYNVIGYVQQNSIAQAVEHFYICTIMESPYFYKSNTNISYLDRLFCFPM